MAKRLSILILLLLIIPGIILSQDPIRFKNEIETITKKYTLREGSNDLILFTGSSSIKRWENVPVYFPDKNIINTGFGGSQMSDLIYYSGEVILRYKPIQVFIYEGDNDLATGEKATDIIREADSLIKIIHKKLPLTEIVLISAKPSPVRWGLKEEYTRLNEMFRQLPSRYNFVKYLDLWTPLIGPSGRPLSELFTSDSLHINSSGYDKWAKIVGKILK